jgi:hypothetical protein
LAAAIVFQTKYQQSCFPRYLAQKSYIIKNPIKVDVTAVETDEMTIISAGRLSPQKNQMLMIEAVSMLHEEFPKLKLEIYGDGTLRDSLLSDIEQNNLNDCVFLGGNVGDIHERMAAARLFLMTSEFEGMPNALLEAMAIGLPCITTDYPGAEEIIQNETNGLVVPRNDAKALADAIRKVLEDNVLEKKIRQNALFSSELYREEEVFKQWDAIVKAEKIDIYFQPWFTYNVSFMTGGDAIMRILDFIILKVCRSIPDKLWIQFLYLKHMQRLCNFRNPKTFNDKIQWLKLYDQRSEHTAMVDKYLVKEYIKEKIGEQYVIPVIACWIELRILISRSCQTNLS